MTNVSITGFDRDIPSDYVPTHTYGTTAPMPVNLWRFGMACKPAYGPWIKPKDPSTRGGCCGDCGPR